MMIQIAIVEDREDEARRLTAFFQKYGNDRDISFQITHFNTADSFIARYAPVYDVVLMDIMMPGTNGMDSAQILRRLDKNVTLVFVTNMAQFAVRGYEVEAFDFIVKPVAWQSFEVKVDRIMAKLRNEQRKESILLNLAEGKKRISPSHIIYVEVVAHKLIYHTTEGNYTVYGSMKAAQDELNDQVFARCNNCYLINLNYVTALDSTSVTVFGEKLQVSRSRKKALMEQLNNFLGGNM